MRCFLAIYPPEELAREWSLLTHHPILMTKPRFRPVPPEQIHLTLAFFPNLDPGQVDELALLIGDFSFEPFRLARFNPGLFGSREQPRVFWLAPEAGSEHPLRSLRRSLRQDFREIGLEPEGGKFRPHFTLGRFRGPLSNHQKEGLGLLLEDLANPNSESVLDSPFTVRQVFLVESQLNPAGARHTVLAESGGSVK